MEDVIIVKDISYVYNYLSLSSLVGLHLTIQTDHHQTSLTYRELNVRITI